MPDNSKHDSRSGRLRSILSGRPSTSFSNPDTAGQEFDSITHDVTPAVTRESFQRVRFSIEVDSVGITPQAARRGTTLLSENALRSALGPGLEAIHSNEPEEPVATPMPRKRNRGYSLRRQLFSRNAEQDQYSDGRLDPGEGAAKIDLPDSMEMGMLAMSPTPPEFTKPLPDELAGIGAQESRPRFMSSSMDARLQRAAVGWSDLKKTVMRTHELPPTKEGRKIPLDAERVDLLMDERTGYQYVNNTVRNTPSDAIRTADERRYEAVDTLFGTFCPSSCFTSFRSLRICECCCTGLAKAALTFPSYFLCVSILQMIPSES